MKVISGELNHKGMKRDDLTDPETGKVTNINRIEFELTYTYPNRGKETLRFISLEVPEEYQDLSKCYLWQQIKKNTQDKDWTPMLKERLNQKYITWQKYMMRNKENPTRIWTSIPLEFPQDPTDIKRETLKRGMRTMTLEENIVLVEIALRNGILQKDLGNKQKLEEFFGIKDLGSEQDNSCIRDFAFYTQQNGKKSGFLRGCPAWGWCSVEAGCFSLCLGYPTSSRLECFGFRLAR